MACSKTMVHARQWCGPRMDMYAGMRYQVGWVTQRPQAAQAAQLRLAGWQADDPVT